LSSSGYLLGRTVQMMLMATCGPRGIRITKEEKGKLPGHRLGKTDPPNENPVTKTKNFRLKSMEASERTYQKRERAMEKKK